MVKIQIDLSESEDRKVSLFKVDQGLETKEMAIKEMIRRYPLKLFSIGQVIECKSCGQFTDSFESEKGYCKDCQKKK